MSSFSPTTVNSKNRTDSLELISGLFTLAKDTDFTVPVVRALPESSLVLIKYKSAKLANVPSVIDANVVVVFVTLIVIVLIPSLLDNVVPLLFKVCL